MYVSTGNHFGIKGADSLSQCLTHMTQLTHLNLSGECAHFNCYSVVCDVWCHIDVCDVCVSTVNKIGIEGAKALSRCLPNLTQLTYLDLSGECATWCVWCNMSHWRVMCVSTGNMIGVEGSKALSQCLPHLTQMTHLDLSCECATCCVWCHIDMRFLSTDNNIGIEGASALSQCLPPLTQLAHLNLCGKCVHIDVLLGVCDVMCVSTDNNIGIKGTIALSQCWPHLTQLTHINLSGECVHYRCVTWCVIYYIWYHIDICDVWVVSSVSSTDSVQLLPHL